MKKIVLELEFEEEGYEEDPNETYMKFSKINTLTNELTKDQRLGVGETWVQTDWYAVEFCYDILLTAIDQDGDPNKGVWTKVDEFGFSW